MGHSCVAISLVLIGAAGCGRVGFDPATRPAPIDAPVDAAPDAPYRSLEMIAVPALGTVVTSTTVLQVGITYRLRASGTADVGGILGDAEYWNFPGATMDLAMNGLSDAGIAIDDPTVALMKTPLTWGAYNPAHVYEIAWPGAGATISANYHDDNPGNNSGSFTLEILGP